MNTQSETITEDRVEARCALNIGCGTFKNRWDFEYHLSKEHNILGGQLTTDQLTAIAWCASDARLPWSDTALSGRSESGQHGDQ